MSCAWCVVALVLLDQGSIKTSLQSFHLLSTQLWCGDAVDLSNHSVGKQVRLGELQLLSVWSHSHW